VIRVPVKPGLIRWACERSGIARVSHPAGQCGCCFTNSRGFVLYHFFMARRGARKLTGELPVI